jgi:hypothetical protein
MGKVDKGRRKQRMQDHPGRPGATPYQPASGRHEPRSESAGAGRGQKARRGLNSKRPKRG